MAVRMGGSTGLSGSSSSSSLGLTGSPVAVIFGDSITAQGTDGVTNTYNAYHGARNYFAWMMVRLGFPFYYVAGQFTTDATIRGIGHNAGVGGDTTTGMLARLQTAVLAKSPNIVFVLAGTNDITGGASYSTITTNLQSIYSRILQSGALCVALPILPRNSADGASNWSSSTQRSLFLRVNTFIRDYALRTKGMILLDPFDRIVDQTSGSNNNILTGYTTDGLHPSPTGGFWIADKGVEIFQPLLTPRPEQNFSVGDLYNATDIPFGNLFTNGQLSGTAGTAGTGVSGSVADSWTVERTSAGFTHISAVGSKTTRISGANSIIQQKLVITTDGTGASSEIMRLRPTTFTISSGVSDATWYEMIMDISVTSPSGGAINGIYIQLQDLSANGVTTRCLDAPGGGNYYWPDQPFSGRYITPPLLTVGTSGLRGALLIDIDASKSASVTVEVSNFMLRRMPTSPATILGR